MSSTHHQPLRLLVVEDSDDDYEILLREVRRGGYQVTSERVGSGQELAAALDAAVGLDDDRLVDAGLWRVAGDPDLMQRGIDLPCIVISGSPNEEAAVQALHAGALDFLSKDKPLSLRARDRTCAARSRRAPRAHELRKSGCARTSSSCEQSHPGSEPAQERVPRKHVARAAHATQRDHRIRRAASTAMSIPGRPEHKEFLADILTSGRHLLQLINDVLDLAKVEAGKLDFRPERRRPRQADRRGRRDHAHRRSAQADRGRRRARCRARRHRHRSEPLQTGRIQLHVERAQVHARWRPRHDSHTCRRSELSSRGRGHGRGHRSGRPRPVVRRVPTARRAPANATKAPASASRSRAGSSKRRAAWSACTPSAAREACFMRRCRASTEVGEWESESSSSTTTRLLLEVGCCTS